MWRVTIEDTRQNVFSDGKGGAQQRRRLGPGFLQGMLFALAEARAFGIQSIIDVDVEDFPTAAAFVFDIQVAEDCGAVATSR